MQQGFGLIIGIYVTKNTIYTFFLYVILVLTQRSFHQIIKLMITRGFLLPKEIDLIIYRLIHEYNTKIVVQEYTRRIHTAFCDNNVCDKNRSFLCSKSHNNMVCSTYYIDNVHSFVFNYRHLNYRWVGFIFSMNTSRNNITPLPLNY